MTQLEQWQRDILVEGIRLYSAVVSQHDKAGPTVDGMPNVTDRDKLDRWCAGSIFERSNIEEIRSTLRNHEARLARG